MTVADAHDPFAYLDLRNILGTMLHWYPPLSKEKSRAIARLVSLKCRMADIQMDG
jgi:hypothetical protein